jgi:hypothetical protein
VSGNEQDMPKWDVALAGLAGDEFRKKAAPLTLDDFRRLAQKYAIRLDDIMETMFLLVINGEWIYTDRDGQHRAIDQQTLDGLYVKRRLSAEDLAAYDGGWQPA